MWVLQGGVFNILFYLSDSRTPLRAPRPDSQGFGGDGDAGRLAPQGLAQIGATPWRQAYKTGRPYSALGYLTPEGFEQLNQDAQSEGLGKLYRDAGGPSTRPGAPYNGGHDVPRNGDGLLTRAGGGGAERN